MGFIKSIVKATVVATGAVTYVPYRMSKAAVLEVKPAFQDLSAYGDKASDKVYDRMVERSKDMQEAQLRALDEMAARIRKDLGKTIIIASEVLDPEVMPS